MLVFWLELDRFLDLRYFQSILLFKCLEDLLERMAVSFLKIAVVVVVFFFVFLQHFLGDVWSFSTNSFFGDSWLYTHMELTSEEVHYLRNH